MAAETIHGDELFSGEYARSLYEGIKIAGVFINITKSYNKLTIYRRGIILSCIWRSCMENSKLIKYIKSTEQMVSPEKVAAVTQFSAFMSRLPLKLPEMDCK